MTSPFSYLIFCVRCHRATIVPSGWAREYQRRQCVVCSDAYRQDGKIVGVGKPTGSGGWTRSAF